MKTTTTTFAFVSYNSIEFLIRYLNQLKESGVIKYYHMIFHKGETNYDGTKGKDHYHVFVYPLTEIPLDQFQTNAREYVNDNPNPLGIDLKPNPKSDIDNWINYVLHDIEYLNKKQLEKEFHYEIKDFITSDTEQLKKDITSAIQYKKRLVVSKTQQIIDDLKKGIDMSLIIAKYDANPFQVEKIAKILYLEKKIKSKHNTCQLDIDTGEITEDYNINEEIVNYHTEYYSNETQKHNDIIDKKLEDN